MGNNNLCDVGSTVQNYMERIKVKYERYRDIVMNTNTAVNSEFKELRKGVSQLCIRIFPIIHAQAFFSTHLHKYFL